MDWLNSDTREFDWVVNHRLFSPNDKKIILTLLQELVRNMNWRPEDVGELFDALVHQLLDLWFLYQPDLSKEMDPRVIHRVVTSFLAPRLFSPNENEKNLIKLLQGLVRSIKWRPEDVSELFDALLQRFESVCRNDRSQLLTWLLQMLHWIQVNYITPTWRSNSGRSLLELVRDTAVTNEALKACLADDEDKTLDEIIEEIRDGDFNQVNNELLAEVKDIVSSVQAALRSRSSGSELSGLKKDLLILCQAAEKTHFRPRLTQMVSWCLMALSKTGRLIQVGTGEGKSCIVAMFAAFRALRGEKVDIMSSSSVLAERDMREWKKKFYDLLKISVDCNINKEDENSKKCYESHIVYGTAEQFAGDWLKHHVLRMHIFGQRTFQCAIVDEVDSLMLDKGHHVVYLSSDTPALQHLNPLLALIWATANQYSKVGSSHIVGQKYPFHQVVLEQIKQKGVFELTVLQMAEDTGVLAKGTVEEIWRKPSLLDEKIATIANVAADKLIEFFRAVETRFPSCQFALHSINTDGSVEELNRSSGGNGQTRVSLLMNGGFCQYMYPDTDSVLKIIEEDVRRFLHFTPRELNKSDGSCYIPGFLSDLVESKLKVWIKNAFHAQTMERDQEYVLEGHGIVPVDYSSTGVVQNFMTLSDGLQQFLEMKHQSKLSDMTIITNYMSNVGLLQKYKSQIYGLSGTLGEQEEIDTMRKICEGIETCQIPSFKRRKLFEVQGVIMKDEKEWREKICDVVTEQTNSTTFRDGRAVLVICETIKQAKMFHRAFGRKVQKKMLYINNNMDNTAISETLQEGDVIIATNLAGRGTGIKISESVKKAGGLFVLQTFLPKNARVEAQAFGRAGRQGSPGSGQLIIYFRHFPPNLSQNSHVDMMMAKNIRDDLAAEELCAYTKFHIPKIKKEERLFTVYLEKLNLLYIRAHNKPLATDVSALNEFWGIWLLTKVSEKDSIETLTKLLEGDLDKALERLKHEQSPLSNLHHYTLHGKYLHKMGLPESIQMYTRAINQDRCWAAVAYYNRAFASLTQQNNNQKPVCLSQALEDLRNALQSIELYCEQLQVTHRYVTQQIPESERKDNRFDKQAMARVRVLDFLKANINEALQKVDRAMKRGGHVKVGEKLICFLVSLKDFLPSSVVLMKEAWHSSDHSKMYQLISQPSFDIINELESLYQLGLTHIYELDTLFSLGGFISKIFSLRVKSSFFFPQKSNKILIKDNNNATLFL